MHPEILQTTALNTLNNLKMYATQTFQIGIQRLHKGCTKIARDPNKRTPAPPPGMPTYGPGQRAGVGFICETKLNFE